MSFLPATPAGLEAAGLEPGSLDAIIVTGDAYVDHSSFGSAILGRLLESHGYRIGIIARPDPDDVGAFRLLGRPKLAFLVTAGAVDSMVSSYTANKKPRSEDEYAPGGDSALCMRADGSVGPGVRHRPNARPDRAVIVYSTMCRQAFKGVPVVIGGIEASLRRLAHYDYWSDTVRKSVLLDSKADILVYGMGERQIVEIMRRLSTSEPRNTSTIVGKAGGKTDLSGIRGTVWAKHIGKADTDGPSQESQDCSDIKKSFPGALVLPDFEALCGSDKESKLAYAASFAIQYANTDAHSAHVLIEPYGDRLVVQEPPAFTLSREELDEVYALHFERLAHPMYNANGGVPALKEVKFSLLSSRGCFGACSFCAISFHQGHVVTSRSIDSLMREAETLVALPDFKGYIHDVGGPTANFRIPACGKMERAGACTDRRCLGFEPCANLKADHTEYIQLLRSLRSIPRVKKVFIRSGVRFDYVMLDPNEDFLRELVHHHVSGQLKVAPEHVSDKVLALMGKPPHRVYDSFASRYAKLNEEAGLKQYLVPYFISAHPGSGLDEAIELAEYMRDTGFVPDQAQDFYPTPGTLATAMWWCEFNPLDGTQVHVAKGARERAMQRALLQFDKPENAILVREALRAAGREDLIGTGPRCLVRPAGLPEKAHKAGRPRR